MKRTIVLFRRIRRMSFARMHTHIKRIHAETGIASPLIFCDMLWCSVRYGIGYLDYHVFGFARKHGKVRKTYMTEADNLALVRRLNDRAYYGYFSDKTVFLRVFADYINRDWLDLRECDANCFARFCKEKHVLFAKPIDQCGGAGVCKILCPDSADFHQLYDQLKQNGQLLVEQTITQHPDMNRLYPHSINTLRITTVICKDGSAHIMYCLLRIGHGGNCVDNISSGGMYTAINDAGQPKGPAFCDKTGQYFSKHPDTDTDFATFVVPYFKQAQQLCLDAAMVEPRIGYVGWDVAITPDGPILIEGNLIPGYDMCQNSAYADCGILPEFQQVLEGQK